MTWAALLPLIVFAYFLSAAPIEFLVLKTGIGYCHPRVLAACEVVFYPVNWCVDRLDIAASAWMLECQLLEELEMMFAPRGDESLSPETIRI